MLGLPNSMRIAYFYWQDGLLFSVDCPVGSPIPRVGEFITHPTTGDTYTVKTVTYTYPTNLPGIVNYIKLDIGDKRK